VQQTAPSFDFESNKNQILRHILLRQLLDALYVFGFGCVPELSLGQFGFFPHQFIVAIMDRQSRRMRSATRTPGFHDKSGEVRPSAVENCPTLGYNRLW
jgi:hypothetical protein